MRLYLEYFLLALLLISGALAWTFHQQSERLSLEVENLEQSLSVVRSANEAQAETIRRLEEQRLADEEALIRLMERNRTLDQQSRALRQELTRLEKEDARDYLDAPVPASVGCLYAPSSCGNGDGEDPSSGTAAHALPPARGSHARG